MIASQTSLLPNPKKNPDKKAPMTSRERWIKYEKSPQGRYKRMKSKLRYRMRIQERRILELERFISEQEN